MDLEEMTIKEMRAAIIWRRNQIGALTPTSARLMSPTFLAPYEKYAEEIEQMETEIKVRKETKNE